MILGTSAVGSEALGSSEAVAVTTTLFTNAEAAIFAGRTALAQLQAAVAARTGTRPRRSSRDHRRGQGGRQR